MKLIYILSILLMTAGCYNLTGANHSSAVKNARNFEKQMKKEGLDMKFLSCDQKDSDFDGYVSCNFKVDGKLQTLECAGTDFIQVNTSCREQKASMRR